MSALLAALYGLCILFLIGLALFVLVHNPRAPLHRLFALLSLALLGWVASLFAFNLPAFSHPSTILLTLGRFNFACMLVALTLAFLFVRQVAARPLPGPASAGLWSETLLLSLITLLSPWVDKQELVQAGQHVTLYGPGFALYVLHVLALLTMALWTAFHPSRRLLPQTQHQLRFIGGGILVTALIALTTNMLLPYAFGDFRFIHVGPLSTILFLGAVGYAVFVLHLFQVHVIIRMTFVLAGLIALGLELYQLALSFLAHLLPFGDKTERGYAATALVLVVNAFTQQPVKRWLGDLIDHLAHKKQPVHNAGRERAIGIQ